MGFERGAVRVSTGVRSPFFPLFQKEIAAQPFELWVGAPWPGCGVSFTKEILGDDGKGDQPIGN